MANLAISDDAVVSYSIPRKAIAAGETAYFPCTIHASKRLYGANIEVYLAGVSGWQSFQVEQSIAAGSTVSLSIPVTLDAGYMSDLSGRSAAISLRFGVFTRADLTGGSTSELVAPGMTALKSRLAPSIGSVTFADTAGYKTRFGAMVQGQSRVSVAAPVTTDPLDPEVTIVRRELTLGGRHFSLTEGTVQLGTMWTSGAMPWQLTVADSMGKTATASGTLNVLAYAAPSIAELKAERYVSVVGDSGGVTYVAAEDGEHVRFSLKASVAKVAAKNQWTLKVANGSASPVTVRSGSDGATIQFTDDRTIITAAVPASQRVTFTFVLADYFQSVEMRATVEKAGAVFDIEPYGVGIGCRAEGTAANPACLCAWPARFEKSLRVDGNLTVNGSADGLIVRHTPLTAGQSVSVPTGSYTTLDTLNITQPGVYFLQYMFEGPPKTAAKIFQAEILLVHDGTNTGIAQDCGPTITGLYQKTLTTVIRLTAGDQIKFGILHHIGSAFSCTWRKSVHLLK